MADRDRYEPSDPKVPGWVVPKDQVASLPPCRECGKPFKLDGAGGVSGGLAIVDTDEGKLYYHGYPENTRARDCYRKALDKGFA